MFKKISGLVLVTLLVTLFAGKVSAETMPTSTPTPSAMPSYSPMPSEMPVSVSTSITTSDSGSPTIITSNVPSDQPAAPIVTSTPAPMPPIMPPCYESWCQAVSTIAVPPITSTGTPSDPNLEFSIVGDCKVYEPVVGIGDIVTKWFVETPVRGTKDNPIIYEMSGGGIFGGKFYYVDDGTYTSRPEDPYKVTMCIGSPTGFKMTNPIKGAICPKIEPPLAPGEIPTVLPGTTIIYDKNGVGFYTGCNGSYWGSVGPQDGWGASGLVQTPGGMPPIPASIPTVPPTMPPTTP